MDIQVLLLLFVIGLCQCYITYTIYKITHDILCALTAFALPLGLGLYIIQVFVLERKHPHYNNLGIYKQWLKWSYIFVFVQYIAAFTIYIDFISYN